MSDGEKSPEEKGVEFVDAMFAGTGHFMAESFKSLWFFTKWGCIGLTIYIVVGTVVAFFVIAACDLLGMVPPWLIVAGIVIGLVIYIARRQA